MKSLLYPVPIIVYSMLNENVLLHLANFLEMLVLCWYYLIGKKLLYTVRKNIFSFDTVSQFFHMYLGCSQSINQSEILNKLLLPFAAIFHPRQAMWYRNVMLLFAELLIKVAFKMIIKFVLKALSCFPSPVNSYQFL